MAENYFNFYDLFDPGENIPFIPINKRNSDKFESFREGVTTWDALSYKYYGNSAMGYIIGMGNPEFPSQFTIDDGKNIRIPFPLSEVLKELKEKVANYKSL